MLTKEDKLQQQWQKIIVSRCGAWISCASCVGWDRDNNQCGLFKIRPPVAVIVTGCDEWEQDIPF